MKVVWIVDKPKFDVAKILVSDFLTFGLLACNIEFRLR